MLKKIKNKIINIANKEYISKYILFLWLYCFIITLVFFPSYTIKEILIADSFNILIYALIFGMLPLIEIAYQLPSLVIYSVLFIIPILLLLVDIAKYKFYINNKLTKNLRLFLSTYIVVIYIYTAIISILLILLLIISYFA